MTSSSKEPSMDFSLKETAPRIGRVSASEKVTSSSFDLVEQMQFIYVRVVRARGLPETSDPFVEISIGSYKGTTRHFEKNPAPDWHEVFAFTKDRIQNTVIEVVVRTKGSDELIGKCSFEVAEIPSRVPPDSPLAPQWYRLEDSAGNRISGELMASVWVGTQADEVFPDAWHSDSAAVDGDSVVNTRSKVYLSPKLWYLRVNIIGAQDLVTSQPNRSPEVFVKGVLGNIALRSRVSLCKSVNPTWNEDMMFVAVEPFEDTLVLSVLDKVGQNKEESLGKCEIKLSQVPRRLTPEPVAALWYNIDVQTGGDDEKKEVKVKFAGRLHLRVSLDGGYHVLDESIQYSSDYRASAKTLWSPPIGVLELGILSASGLMPMKSRDGRGTTDAFCVAKYGQKWVRTRTIINSLAPKWNEQYTWEVYDPYTVITIGVFDNSHLLPPGSKNSQEGPQIGKVRIRLSTLETDRVYTHSYPLIVLNPKGVKKMGEIQLAVRFTCTSVMDMLQAYVQPLLPQMHYLNPLSVYQLDSLRHQATNILSLKLSRNEPPLRKEIIEYMLDVGSHMWSLRRARASFERILSFFSGFSEAWKWFDQVRKWTSPVKTVAVHVLLLIVVCFPKLTVVSFLFYCSAAGVLSYRLRPRHPPHMDIKLSKADVAQPDELDEEFDSFPSSKQGTVLKQRYDRLRGISGRMMVVLGDLATQGERVRNLLSWRDPRATGVFVVFCMVAGVLVYALPARVLFISMGFYVMRHPKLRIAVPSKPQNFFRRLPSKADSML